MDYPCTKFGDFSFSHFGFIVWTEDMNTQTESCTGVSLKHNGTDGTLKITQQPVPSTN